MMSESGDNMSDKSETGSDNGNHSDICRDYQRNMCKRGKRCKYRHPDEAKSAEVNISDYTFCHDFQNNGCRRANCKFLHCTREEEDEARVTGELPPRVVQAASVGIGVNPAQVIAKGGVPMCKDFLKGNCRRGNMCKYKHISSEEYEFLQRTPEGRDMFPCNTDPRFERFEIHSDVKRRRIDHDFPNEGCRPFASVFRTLPPSSSFQLIEDENVVLRKKVDDLKKQVADLTSTNEMLLEQNARYRVSKPNILESYSSAGVQSAFQASSLSHLNTNLAQQISLNNNAMNIMQQQQQQHQSQQRHTLLQQRLFHEDIAAGQRSLSAPLMLNTALRSIDPPMGTVSLSQTMVHIQPSSNKNVSSNILDGNASLVPYPIMSQGMRMSVGNCTR